MRLLLLVLGLVSCVPRPYNYFVTIGEASKVNIPVKYCSAENGTLYYTDYDGDKYETLCQYCECIRKDKI